MVLQTTDRWVVRGVPATLEKSRKRHQEDEQEKVIAQARREQDAKAAVAAEALELRWPWTPLKRKVGAPTYDDVYEREPKRPCTWHPKSGPRAWEFGSPAAAAAWAVGTAHPEGPQEGAETGTPQPDVTGEARTGESQVVKSEHLNSESGDEGQGPEADAKPDRKRYAKRISIAIVEIATVLRSVTANGVSLSANLARPVALKVIRRLKLEHLVAHKRTPRTEHIASCSCRRHG